MTDPRPIPSLLSLVAQVKQAPTDLQRMDVRNGDTVRVSIEGVDLTKRPPTASIPDSYAIAHITPEDKAAAYTLTAAQVQAAAQAGQDASPISRETMHKYILENDNLRALWTQAQRTIAQLDAEVLNLRNYRDTHPDREAHPRQAFVLLEGNTYPIRDQIKAAGGKWNAKHKGWMVPGEEYDRLAALRPIREPHQHAHHDRSQEDDGRTPY